MSAVYFTYRKGNQRRTFNYRSMAVETFLLLSVIIFVLCFYVYLISGKERCKACKCEDPPLLKIEKTGGVLFGILGALVNTAIKGVTVDSIPDMRVTEEKKLVCAGCKKEWNIVRETVPSAAGSVCGAISAVFFLISAILTCWLLCKATGIPGL